MHRRSGPRSGTVLELSGPARQPRAASATVTWRPPGPGLTGRAAAAASRPHQQARESPLRGRHGGLAGSADSDPDWQEIIIQVKAAPAAQPTLTPQGDSGRLPSHSLYVPNLNRAAARVAPRSYGPSCREQGHPRAYEGTVTGRCHRGPTDSWMQTP